MLNLESKRLPMLSGIQEHRLINNFNILKPHIKNRRLPSKIHIWHGSRHNLRQAGGADLIAFSVEVLDIYLAVT